MMIVFGLTTEVCAEENVKPGVPVGSDLLPVFARAHAGGPLRVAAIGGSITQAGGGWIEGWLREQFPKAVVTMRNAGLSATGSQLGVFRLERDVISAQPDLVFIEFVVNDVGLSDDEAIRYTESIVVRLKSLPNPPAVVFLKAAAKGGSHGKRHHRVAEHYGLLNIDLQAAVDRHVAESGSGWNSLMTDDVHPNEAGHAFYERTIAKALAPYVEAAASTNLKSSIRHPPSPLPSPLSALPLLLDGCLMPLDPQPGWRKEPSLPFWWNMFFNGVISAEKTGATLNLSARGSEIGLFYALDPAYGAFYASVDGGTPVLIDCSLRAGYGYSILGRNLSPCEHKISIVISQPIGRPAGGSVKIGYFLVAGADHATGDLAQQGNSDLAALANRTFSPVPTSEWEWIGPYGGNEKTVGPTADLETVFPPEAQLAKGEKDATEPADKHAWTRVASGKEALLDFAALTGWSDRGVCYARTTVRREKAGTLRLAWQLDYFGKLWINGRLVKVVDGGHGNPKMPMLIPVELQAGDNTILVKIHSGSRGSSSSVLLEDID
jgi:lysophospholipase L1-like esterase